MKRSWSLGAGAVLCCVALTACDSAKPAAHSRSSSASLPPPASSATLTTLPITPLPSSPVPSDPAALAATNALLSAAQLSGFQEIPWTDSPIPQPCTAADATPVLTTYPSKTHVGRQFHLASPEAFLTEQIDVFATTAKATTATKAALRGLDCIDGNFYLADGSAQPVTIHGPADLTSVVGGDADTASAWTLQNGELSATVLLIRDRQVLVTLSFIAPIVSDLHQLPDGRSIAHLALTNVRNARIAD